MMAPSDAVATWARFVLARRALATVTTGFQRHRVDVLAVKGIVTSGILYDVPGERPLSDVDLRIRRRDLGRVFDASVALGFPIVHRSRSYESLVLELDGLEIDVESHIGPPGVSATTTDELFSRATRDEIGFWLPEIHDHAVLLTINVFKDKLTHAMPWALEDARRIVRTAGFALETFVARLERARVATLAWIVADWMTRQEGHREWQQVRSLLRRPHRPFYRPLMAHLERRGGHDLPVRLLARVASDDPRRWPGALARALGWELGARWDARRR